MLYSLISKDINRILILSTYSLNVKAKNRKSCKIKTYTVYSMYCTYNIPQMKHYFLSLTLSLIPTTVSLKRILHIYLKRSLDTEA